MKIFLKVLNWIAPQTVARLIYNRISNPQKRKLRDFEETILNEAKLKSLKFRDFVLQGYSWGKEGRPIALLIHGWEGQAGNFGALVSGLIDKGYKIYAYDGPAHGKSTQKPTNMFEYSDFISERIKILEPTLIISHSFGTVSTQLGLLKIPNFNLKQWVIVTTPFSFKEYIESIIKKMGLSRITMDKLAKLIENDASIPLDTINMATLSPKMNPINSILIIHSTDDKVFSIHDAERTAQYMKGSQLIKLNGLGHYKILWSDKLKEILSEKI